MSIAGSGFKLNETALFPTIDKRLICPEIHARMPGDNIDIKAAFDIMIWDICGNN